ncbi:MAG: hypothetical protein ACXACU_14270 [Candidatus Hodarchaeales archaeon]|jgi:hypothetical protein
MSLTLLLLGYGVSITTFLTIVYVRSEYYKHLYKNVLWDSYSLERIRLFFQKIELLLKLMYPIVDKLNRRRGRPATDRRFQLRFVIWWKFFSPGSQKNAVDRLNKSPELQQILEAPVNPYTRASLRRFLKDVGEEGFRRMGFLLGLKLFKKGILDTSKVVLDSFPVYSYLNKNKCLKIPKFDKKLAKLFYQELNLNHIISKFPIPRNNSAPLVDKLKVWIHQYLWDIPSNQRNHYYIFGRTNRREVLGLEKGWKAAKTYQVFLDALKSLPNAFEIEYTTVTEVVRVLRHLGVALKSTQYQRIKDLRCVFHTPHRLKDPTITPNYCVAKDQHFMGRGGLLAIVPTLGIPLFLQVTAKYKQSEDSIQAFLKSISHQYGGLLQKIEVYADSEFGTEGIKDALKCLFKATPYIDVYARSVTRSTLTVEQKNIRKTVERVIARLETNFSLEHPSVLGNDSVAIHTQLCFLCDLLLVSYNLLAGNHSHPHSLSSIRG